ncbi:hypothetical protein [Pontibacter cellulosilyticus]|uniref:6-bladed beta-propeller n=1 Tax=Pontibacter cellulosilyticus TaxID=1720253 RepID=A0A923N5N4_9BACT|nr:hypothetical protein [Pontibacter cellulosilyticus]MBC5993058.1 hypothetical protein [Pontibacter cellulosilyticus]
MKAKNHIAILVLALLTALAPAFAQEAVLPLKLKYSHSIAVTSPTTISKDRNGNIYFLAPNRSLLRIDSLGNALGTFSPPSRGRIASIDAWNPMKILLFYEDRQELFLLDRFLRPIGNTTLRDINYKGTAKAAALASDDSFWLFDETNLTLSKLNMQLRQVTIETPLNLILEKERFNVKQLREYQNMVYLLDANGIFVFDNLGNYKRKLPIAGVDYINFMGNELYFVKAGVLHFVNLYTSETRTLPLPKPYITALASEGQLYLFNTRALDIYTW